MSIAHPSGASIPSHPHVDVHPHVEDDGTVVVSFRGDLDFAAYEIVTAQILAIEETADGKLVFDFEGLNFIDSSGVRLVSLTDRRSGERGRQFEIRGASEATMRVFDVTGLSQRLRISS